MKKLLVFILMLISIKGLAQYDSIKVSTPNSGVGDNLRTAGAKMNAVIAHLNTVQIYNISQPEMAILNGALASTAELNYLVGVTSSVQTQINTKAPINNAVFTGTHTIPLPYTVGTTLVTSVEEYSTENYGATGTGNIVMSTGPTMTNATINYPATATGTVVAATGITAAMLSRMMYFNTAAAIDITADPQIANGTSGQIITIIGSSDTNTLTLDDAEGLRLASQIVLGIGDNITLFYEGTIGDWVELSRSNN